VDGFREREGRELSRFERAAIEREATADTRGNKTGNDPAVLRDQWRGLAAELSRSPASVIDAVRAAEVASRAPMKTTVEAIVTALSERRSVRHDLDVRREITDRFEPRHGIPVARWAGPAAGRTNTPARTGRSPTGNFHVTPR